MPHLRTSIAVLVLIVCVFCSINGVAAQEATSPPEDQPIDLTGLWLDSERVVQVTQSGNVVTGMYVEPHECDHRDGTSSETDLDFNANLDGMALTGEITSCYWDTASPASSGFRNVPLELTLSVDGNTLTGTWYNSVEDEDMPLTITRIPCRLAEFDGDTFIGRQVVADLVFIPMLKRIDAYAADHNLQLDIQSSFRATTNVPGAIVRPARASNHLVGHAIDVNVIYTTSNGSTGFCNSGCLGDDNLPTDIDGFITDIRNDPDLRWGGDFGDPDPVHIDDGLNENDWETWQKLRDEIQADPDCFTSSE